MHLAVPHGHTIDDIRADGFEPAAELEWLGPDGTAAADVQAATALAAVARTLAAGRPDALVLVGDRFETAAAALAATIERIPIVHLHGGEQTGGAFDDQLRHAISKLSHLHLVSHDEHARRVAALGEDPATIHVVGAPGLDAAMRGDLAGRDELEEVLALRPLRSPLVVVTIQPVTLDPDPAAVAAPILQAIDEVPATYVFTLPNADPGAERVRDLVRAAAEREGRVSVEALGERRYWGLMRLADAMLGNSSSGLVEAPALDLPAVNVGDRQAGRLRSRNVIDVAADPVAIAAALRRALAPETRAMIARDHPPLADGLAGRRIADIIAAWRPPNPPRKAPIDVGT
jgi:UDP-hydrolysing UDP-N-acetyl-D-glucosamine 2-epimerase